MIRAERCSEIRPTSLNGHTRDLEGRLISCSHGDRRVHRTEYDGRIVVLAHHYQGKRLNSPNDVVVKSDRGRLVLGKPEAEAYGSVASSYRQTVARSRRCAIDFGLTRRPLGSGSPCARTGGCPCDSVA